MLLQFHSLTFLFLFPNWVVAGKKFEFHELKFTPTLLPRKLKSSLLKTTFYFEEMFQHWIETSLRIILHPGFSIFESEKRNNSSVELFSPSSNPYEILRPWRHIKSIGNKKWKTCRNRKISIWVSNRIWFLFSYAMAFKAYACRSLLFLISALAYLRMREESNYILVIAGRTQ